MKNMIKNIFPIILCIFTLSLFSCVSTPVEENDSAITETTDETSPTEQNTLDETNNDDFVPTETKKDVLFPIPETLIEPEIITLEPEDLPPVTKEETKKEKQDLEEELVVIEEPLPITEEIIKNSTNKQENLVEQKQEINKKDEKVSNKDVEINHKELIKSDPSEIKSEKKVVEKLKSTVEEPTIENNKKDDFEVETNDEIIPSRSVTLKIKEYVDVTYPGTGWIYMGITDGSKDLAYFGRALGTENTTFSLQARKAGKKILHFYKNDHLTNEYLDDYVEVIILNETGSTKTHIATPPYKQPIPKKSKEMFYKENIENESEIDDVILIEDENKITKNIKNDDKNQITKSEKTESIETPKENLKEKNITEDINTLLKEAQLLYNEKEFKVALEKINNFLIFATKNIDEGLFLKGQILEAKSEIQDIKGAIETYTKLTKEYPASRYWNDANKRIVYLKRFYLEVR